MEEGKGVFKIVGGKTKDKRPLGRTRLRWEDNFRIDFKGLGVNTRNWVDLAQGRDY